MASRSLLWALMIVTAFALRPGAARAQDVPGIEICTVEKTMERRTSCLQSNVDFLQKTTTKLGIDSAQKIDAANRRIEALRGMVAELQKTVSGLQAAQKNRRSRRRRKAKKTARRRMGNSRLSSVARHKAGHDDFQRGKAHGPDDHARH